MYAEVIHRKQGLINSVKKYCIGASATAIQWAYDHYFIKYDLSRFIPNGLKEKEGFDLN